jgi:hypothetical protein
LGGEGEEKERNEGAHGTLDCGLRIADCGVPRGG